MYVWRPYRIPTFDGFRYFLTIADDYSRCTLCFLLRSKTNTFRQTKYFLALVKPQFHPTVKIVRSNNRTEIFNLHVR